MVAISNLRGLDELIECRDDYREGRPHIAGTGISVGRIGVLHTLDGLTADEIAEEMGITPEQTYAALAYYLRNQETIDADLRAQYEETARIAIDHRAPRRGEADA
jgi:uncharacterized protein (DUF433 family)